MSDYSDRPVAYRVGDKEYRIGMWAVAPPDDRPWWIKFFNRIKYLWWALTLSRRVRRKWIEHLDKLWGKGTYSKLTLRRHRKKK